MRFTLLLCTYVIATVINPTAPAILPPFMMSFVAMLLFVLDLCELGRKNP